MVGDWVDTGQGSWGPDSQRVGCWRGEGKCWSKGKAHAAGWLPWLLLRKRCLVTCQLLSESGVGRARFLSRGPVCQIAFGLSGWHSESLA